MVPSIGFAFSFLCFLCGLIRYSLLSVHFPTVKFRLLKCILTDCGHYMRIFLNRLVIHFCDDRHVLWKWKDHFIFIYGDLNNSYHNSAHFLKLCISSSVVEKILKEKAEGMETYSKLSFLQSVRLVCVVLLHTKVREEELCRIQIAILVSCCRVFWKSRAMSLIQRLRWRWAGVRIRGCNTMNEQERNVGD